MEEVARRVHRVTGVLQQLTAKGIEVLRVDLTPLNPMIEVRHGIGNRRLSSVDCGVFRDKDGFTYRRKLCDLCGCSVVWNELEREKCHG